MTGGPGPRVYAVRRIADFGEDHAGAAPWADLPPLLVDRYLWLNNGYEPRVEARLGWSPRFVYVRFEVAEKRAAVRYLKFQDPVYKDSCVEFFVDMFPGKRLGYLNFEMNAVGTLLAQFGPDRNDRKPLWPEDLAGFSVLAADELEKEGGAPAWSVAYRIPLALFKKFYGEDIRPGHRARANFYKCGDDTPIRHYGAWSPVGTPSPDFHRPEYFGELVFE